VPEEIPDSDMVSRLLFEPSMRPKDDILWENVFQFPSKDGNLESVIWRKYAAAIDEVHGQGCTKQTSDRQKGNARSTYFGAITGNAGSIREIRSAGGVFFTILHVPAEGSSHAHIGFSPNSTKIDRVELKVLLKREFGPLEPHACVA
jgi:hypothetical protein